MPLRACSKGMQKLLYMCAGSYKKVKQASMSIETDVEVSASEADHTCGGMRQKKQKRYFLEFYES